MDEQTLQFYRSNASLCGLRRAPSGADCRAFSPFCPPVVRSSTRCGGRNHSAQMLAPACECARH